MDYIRTMRKKIGHETLFTVGCGIIIKNAGRNEKVIWMQASLQPEGLFDF
jgi:hypothetical protein